MLEEYAEEYYGDEIKKYLEELSSATSPKPDAEEEELSIEDAIAKEMAELKGTSNAALKTKEEKKKELFRGMEIGCECGRFFVRGLVGSVPLTLSSYICAHEKTH